MSGERRPEDDTDLLDALDAAGTGTGTGTDEATGAAEHRQDAVVVRAHNLTIAGAPTTAPLTFAVTTGELVVVEGPASSGKTALLLTIGARMRPAGGDLDVLGHALPHGAHSIRSRTGLGPMHGVNELDDALTVEQHIAERLIFQQPWWKPWVSKTAVRNFIDVVNTVVTELRNDDHAHEALLRPLPPRTFISDLPPLEQFVLATALALIGHPDLLLIDDIDRLRDSGDRRRAWLALGAFLDGGTRPTVIVTCQDTTDLPDAVTPDLFIPLTSTD